jgi:predicted O-methyltransferase YrrM
MSTKTIGLSDELAAYVVAMGVREPDVLRRLREETAALPQSGMQVSPEQGALLAMLVELMGARWCLEVGTFTGYSSTAMALALPEDGRLLCCDVSDEWTSIARRAWAEAGVDGKVELRIQPALTTLDELLEDGHGGRFDLAFLDADKVTYDDYYERLLQLVRPGGLIAIDNVLWSGAVLDEDTDDASTLALQALNAKLAVDERISVCLLPVADGVTLARRR